MAKRSNMAPDPAQRWSAEEARAALAAAGDSRLSLRGFARREGIDPQRLYWWRKRLETGATDETSLARPEPMFVEIEPGGELVGGASPIEVLLRSGRVLRVPRSFDAAALRQLMELLE